MLRAMYGALMWLAQPLLRRKLARRGRLEPGYLHAVEERFGHYTQAAGAGFVWVHAVSLGETRAAAVLVKALRAQWPGMRLLLTHGTATGRAEGAGLLQQGDVQVWQPWDAPGAVDRFLAHFKPCLGVLMETEVWPQLCAACTRRGVPVALVNARLSDKSLAAARRLAWLARPAYASLTAVLAQTPADAQRLRQIGARVTAVPGNLKFDARPDAAQLGRGRHWRAGLARPVVLLASSREGEELEFFRLIQARMTASQAQGAIKVEADEIQWMVVPRHPQRFGEVVSLAQQAGLSVSRRSGWRDDPVAAQVWVGDSLGEMALYYGLASVALLGGSFEPLGGQNLIEAAACGCPVVMGPHTFNFAEAAEGSERAGAAVRVAGMKAGVEAACALALDSARREQAASCGLAFVALHAGAATQTAEALIALQ